MALKAGEKLAWLVAAIFVLISAALAIALLSSGKVPDPAKIRFIVETPSTSKPFVFALSPDGKHLLEAVTEKSGYMLWVRALENLSGQLLPGTEIGSVTEFPFWSPDGRAVAFFADGKLKKADIFGGPVQTLCDAANVYGGTWNSDGVIVFGSGDAGLFRVSATGGTPTQLTELDKSSEETAHRHPIFLPDGKHFLFAAISAKPEDSAIYVGALDSKERKRLLTSQYKALFAPPGYLLFIRDGDHLMAQRFDPNRLELSGDPFPVVEGVGANLGNSGAGFTVSANGMLAYRPADSTIPSQLVLFDRTGRQTGGIEEPERYLNPVLSPDLQRLAVSETEGTARNIWIKDLIRNTDMKFTFGSDTDDEPLWSPDGSKIAFASTSNGGIPNLFLKNSDNVRSEEILLKSDHRKMPLDWSFDGRFILYQDLDPKTKNDLWVLPITEEGKPGKPEPVLNTLSNEFQGQFSPDGKWIVYVSDESKTNQVYVQSFPVSGTQYPISTSGGVQPRWRGDGKELFFLSPKAEMMAVEVTKSKDGGLHPGVPHKLFQMSVGSAAVGFQNIRNSYDVTPDGQRFFVNFIPSSNNVLPITVILNWLSPNEPPKTP